MKNTIKINGWEVEELSNPFNELYEIMGSATKIEPSFFIAKVKNSFPDIEIQLNKVGVKVEFLPHTEGVSSTILSEKITEK